MTGPLACRTATGPIRLRIDSDTRVSVRLLSAPLTVRVLGTPGPVGEQGSQGPAGPQGPPGTLDTGIVLDGGNF